MTDMNSTVMSLPAQQLDMTSSCFIKYRREDITFYNFEAIIVKFQSPYIVRIWGSGFPLQKHFKNHTFSLSNNDMCVYTHTYKNICVQIQIQHTGRDIQIYSYVHSYMHTFMHTYMHENIYANTPPY